MTTAGQTSEFDKRYQSIGRLMEERQLRVAHQEALVLVRDFPERAKGYYLLNLIQCIGNLGGGAFNTPRLIDQMWHNATDTDCDIIAGDMRRDQAIGHIRFRQLNRVQLAIDAARTLHLNSSDPNRLSCLIGIEAQLASAQGKYHRAVQLHAQADAQWQALGDKMDAGMAYLNLVQWLRAEVGLNSGSSSSAKLLTQRIQLECPPQLRSRVWQARIIRLPFAGLWLAHYLETHRR